MIDDRRRVCSTLWRRKSILAVCGLTLSGCLHACTRSANSEAPILDPEPVVELSEAGTKTASLAKASLDRSHWMVSRFDSVDGRVAHAAIVAGGWARDDSVIPSAGNVLSAGNGSATDLADWVLGSIEAAWQTIRSPVALVWRDMPEAHEISPVGSYERAAEPTGGPSGMGVDALVPLQ